jgi:hypothetical protein
MKTTLTQDKMGTHIDWQHEGITPKMIDWFWSNMEKSFLLWHPAQHEPLTWAVPVKHGNLIGAVHLAPQTWADGTRQNLYIKFFDVKDIEPEVKEYIIYDHCIVTGCIGLGAESLENPKPWGYRVHQWQKTDSGVVGKSNAIGTIKKETPEEGIVWSKHCIEEIENWGAFLPEMYNLFTVITNTDYNPYTDLTVEGRGKDLKYKYIPQH